MTLALLISLLMVHPAYSQIFDDGNSHGVIAIGTSTDLLLPNNNQIVAITFNLVGGDGGTAEVHDAIPIVGPSYSHKSNGGAGATTTATFPVGSGPGKIPLGSTIRFVEGARGQNGSSGGVLGNGFDYGGGGGGSAVLYQPPSSSAWILLAVAGGGGGAYQGMFSYFSVITRMVREDVQEPEVAPVMEILVPGGGGSNGAGGGGNGLGGGGGAIINGGGVLCVGFGPSFTAGEGGAGGSGVGYGGDDDGCLSFVWRNGGAGFGAGAGGGGGGYSGGGVGGTTGRGGGGGSYVSISATSQSKTAGGSDSSPDNGSITYQVTLNQPLWRYVKMPPSISMQMVWPLLQLLTSTMEARIRKMEPV